MFNNFVFDRRILCQAATKGGEPLHRRELRDTEGRRAYRCSSNAAMDIGKEAKQWFEHDKAGHSTRM